MAGSQVLTNALIKWKTTAIQSKANSVGITYESEVQDLTAFTDGTRVRKGGLNVWSVEVEGFSDDAAGGINSALFPDVGSTGTILIRPTTAAQSTDNPSYTGTAVLAEFSPLSGGVGEPPTFSASFVSSGTLSRTTASTST